MNKETTPVKIIPYSFAKMYNIVLKDMAPDHAIIAHSKAVSADTFCELERFLQCPIQLVQVDETSLQKLLTQNYETTGGVTEDMLESMDEALDLNDLAQGLPKAEDLLDSQDDAPVIRLLNALFSQAIKQQASDIHIETFEENVIVRFRVDGILHQVLMLNRMLAPLLISRLKVMAKLDIAEKRLPQDGRISLRIAGHSIDVRMSTLPSSYGERVVLRLLDRQAAKLDLNLLGMADNTFKNIQKLIKNPHGILLVTGPTGSGKTTSLYAMLTRLNESTRNILTVEDPIEYDLAGIGQTQVNTKVNMSFAKGLRAILRQDPDVVMIGEIRDIETAEIAVQASLTGHLVLSTLHTNTAIGAIARLRDMGVEPFLLASSVIGLIAQRLVRTLCKHCKQAQTVNESEKEILQCEDNTTIYHPKGCEHCNFTGYLGRSGIYEVITVDDTLLTMVHHGENEPTMERHIRKNTPSIRRDGLRRVLAGDTTVEEVLRVVTKEE